MMSPHSYILRFARNRMDIGVTEEIAGNLSHLKLKVEVGGVNLVTSDLHR